MSFQYGQFGYAELQGRKRREKRSLWASPAELGWSIQEWASNWSLGFKLVTNTIQSGPHVFWSRPPGGFIKI